MCRHCDQSNSEVMEIRAIVNGDQSHSEWRYEQVCNYRDQSNSEVEEISAIGNQKNCEIMEI